MNLKRKLGIIRYPRRWIEDHPIALMNALHEFIVLDARYHYPSDSIQALGIHPMFDEVSPDSEPLFYDFFVEYKRDSNGYVTDIVYVIMPHTKHEKEKATSEPLY